MRILVVCQHYWPEPYRLDDLCQELTRRGHRVQVLTGLPNYPTGTIYPGYRWHRQRRQQRQGVKIRRVFTVGRRRSKLFRVLNYYSFSLSSCLHCRTMQERFDVVLAYQTSPVMMARAALVYAKRHRCPCLLYCLDLWPASLGAGGIRPDSWIYKLYRRVSARIYRQADLVALGSREYIPYMTDYLHLPPEKLLHLPQYADETLLPDPAEPKQQFDLLFAGNVGAAQNLPGVLQAAQLLKEHMDIHWHIVGDGPQLPHCRALARDWALENVYFYGHLEGEKLQQHYTRADALLVPMCPDPLVGLTLPLKATTGLALGKPLLAWGGSALQRLVEEADCGYALPPTDFQALAAAVLRLRDDPRRTQYGENGRRYYQKHCSRTVFLDRLEETLLALCRKGARL